MPEDRPVVDDRAGGVDERAVADLTRLEARDVVREDALDGLDRVSADSATGTLLERGIIEESGRSQFGAVLYRTTPLFLKLFGLNQLSDLPDPSAWDPTPDEEHDLRERLLSAGDVRAGRQGAPEQPGLGDAAPEPVA